MSGLRLRKNSKTLCNYWGWIFFILAWEKYFMFPKAGVSEVESLLDILLCNKFVKKFFKLWLFFYFTYENTRFPIQQTKFKLHYFYVYFVMYFVCLNVHRGIIKEKSYTFCMRVWKGKLFRKKRCSREMVSWFDWNFHTTHLRRSTLFRIFQLTNCNHSSSLSTLLKKYCFKVNFCT